jgi:thioredoxin:protein disulfide reductase
MKRIFGVTIPLLFVIFGAYQAAYAGILPQQASAAHTAGVAKVQGFASREPVPANSKFDIAIVAELPPGYHMNAHKISDPYLIPTTITGDLPAGIQQTDIVYPPGKSVKFSFSQQPLNVYEGKVVIRAKLTASGDVKTGAIEIPFTLRYQACNESSCLPPVHVPVHISIQVAAAGTPSHAMHAEIFTKE